MSGVEAFQSNARKVEVIPQTEIISGAKLLDHTMKVTERVITELGT